MDKYQIINELATDKVLESMIPQNIPAREDLIQDILMDLLEKDDDLIEGLYERKELRSFLYKMVKNNICSKSSPYYRKYRYKVNQMLDVDELVQLNMEHKIIEY